MIKVIEEMDRKLEGGFSDEFDIDLYNKLKNDMMSITNDLMRFLRVKYKFKVKEELTKKERISGSFYTEFNIRSRLVSPYTVDVSDSDEEYNDLLYDKKDKFADVTDDFYVFARRIVKSYGYRIERYGNGSREVNFGISFKSGENRIDDPEQGVKCDIDLRFLFYFRDSKQDDVYVSSEVKVYGDNPEADRISDEETRKISKIITVSNEPYYDGIIIYDPGTIDFKNMRIWSGEIDTKDKSAREYLNYLSGYDEYELKRTKRELRAGGTRYNLPRSGFPFDEVIKGNKDTLYVRRDHDSNYYYMKYHV